MSETEKERDTENMAVQSQHFQFIDIAPPIDQSGYKEVAFSVNCFTVPYIPICIKCGELHFDPCVFEYTKFHDDWLKLTLPSGVKLIVDDFEPLAAMLF